MFGHDDHHDDDNKDEAVTVAPASDDTTTSAPPPAAPAVPQPEELSSAPADDDVLSSSNSDDADLLNLKKQALEELSPLVEHLNQTPEEKFKTTMMLIQATDSSNLIKDAHDAALAIPDEKVRAQALLDIVNEINYFTQK